MLLGGLRDDDVLLEGIRELSLHLEKIYEIMEWSLGFRGVRVLKLLIRLCGRGFATPRCPDKLMIDFWVLKFKLVTARGLVVKG